MDFEFSSKEELYNRVKPALRAKTCELHRLGYTYINYLIETKWKTAHNLSLSDIVDDILNTLNKDIDSYLKGKIQKSRRTQYFDVF